MTKDEALKLALEALEADPAEMVEDENGHMVFRRIQAIITIKEALAQTEPNYKKALEVWLDKTEWVQKTVKPHELGMHRADVLKQRIEATLAQPEQLHVENRRLIDRIETIGVPVGVGGFATTTTSQPDWIERERAVGYREGHRAALAQRTWVGLTDKEIDELWMSHHDDFGNALSATGYERAIEAKLKDKNVQR
jgi:hypothetical protein